jgi:hypothetical protein
MEDVKKRFDALKLEYGKVKLRRSEFKTDNLVKIEVVKLFKYLKLLNYVLI